MIRRAQPSDLAAVVGIYNASIPGRMATADLEPVSIDARRPWFEAHNDAWPLWVDDNNGTLRGWIGLQPFRLRRAYDGTAELSVYVAPVAQRRGVARALLAHALDEAPRTGKTALMGLVLGHNRPSLDLFEGFGFVRWGVLPSITHIDGTDRDVVIVGLRFPRA